jgi:hypothetical protein
MLMPKIITLNGIYFIREFLKSLALPPPWGSCIDAHGGGERGRGAPHVPPIKIFENFHIKMQ